MSTATVIEAETNSISEFGPVPDDLLDLTNKQHELRMYRLATDKTKAIGEALGFAAAFESTEVLAAYADITGDESYFNFEIKFNTRPQTIALRYKERWSPVESSGSRKPTTETPVKDRSQKTVYHAFLEATILERIATLLRIEQEPLSKLLIRINFKDKTLALVATEDAAAYLPDMEAFKTVHIPRTQVQQEQQEETESMNDQNDTPEAAEDLSDSQPEVQPASPGEESSESQPQQEQVGELISQADSPAQTEESPVAETPAQAAPAVQETAPVKEAAQTAAPSARVSEPAPKADVPPAPKQSAPKEYATPKSSTMSQAPAGRSSDTTPKYHTYSQSEVDTLIKRSAENVTNTVTTKINAQTKAVKETLKNQEYAFNQSLDKLTKHMDEANAKLDKATAELNNASSKQMDSFRASLNKELEDFKTSFNKQVLPGIKLLDARLEQLADVKKQTQNPGGINPGMLMGVMVAVAIVSVVNLFIGWYAFDRISNLEKSHSELMLKTAPSATSDVPVPDLMKDQINKETPATTPATSTP